MPIYEYQCQRCDRRLETLQRVSEPPLTTCSECGGELKKLVSAPAFQFKGEGWYVTDYARKKDGGTKGDKAEKAGKGDEKPQEAKEKDAAKPADSKGAKADKAASSSSP